MEERKTCEFRPELFDIYIFIYIDSLLLILLNAALQ